MITINRSPNQTINAANSDVLYVVTSNSSSEATFNYLVDIIESPAGPNDIVTRLKQPPNPNGIGVFNLGRISLSRIEGDPYYNINMFKRADNSINRYRIYFGEEYGTPSIIYTGEAGEVTGAPAVSSSDGSTYTYFINATLNRNETLGSNFDALSFYGTGSGKSLTDIPRNNICIELDEFYTVGILNGPLSSSSPEFNDIYQTIFEYYDDAGTLLGTETKVNANAGTDSAATDAPRSNSAEPFSSIQNSFFTDAGFKSRLQYVQIGPGHNTLPPNTTNYKVTIENENGESYDEFNFKVCEKDCVWPTYRLLWQNSYGTYDSYSFKGKNEYRNSRTDSQYGKGFIDYSINSTTTNPYDRSKRGKKNFFTERNQIITVNTQWLTQEWADWLEGLFESPDVYLVDEDKIIPINLITADYSQQNDPRQQKLKSYTIEFEYSNPKRPY